MLGVTVLLVALLAFLVQRTSIGRALRAVAENRDVARLLGVPAGRITLIAFMLSGALAGAAGVLIGVHYAAITPYIGVEIGLKAIAVMVVGGTTRIWGALIAGPLMGVVEVMTVAYGGSQIRDFVVYGFMILILLLASARIARRQPQRSGPEGLTMSMYYAGLLADIGILLLGRAQRLHHPCDRTTLARQCRLHGDRRLSHLLADGRGRIAGHGGADRSRRWCRASIGIVVGFPALRLKGIYLAMATLGFGEMVRSFFLNFAAMGGAGGFHGMHHVSTGYIWTWALLVLVLSSC